MAKKTNTEDKNVFTFDELNSELKKLNPYGSVANDSKTSEVSSYIDSGNYLLNAALTGSLFKGWPTNRMSCVAAPSGCGKSYLLCAAAKRATESGYHVVYFDTENAIDRQLLENFGIDTSKVNHQPIQTVQEFRTIITTILDKLKKAKEDGKEIPKMLFILDSLGNLASQKEIDDAIAGSDKADMTRAKILKSLFRIIMVPMSEIGATMLVSNHVYDSQSFIPTVNISGGTGIIYSASIIMTLTKAQLKEKENRTGIVVTAKSYKNRFAKPQSVKFHIHFTKGVNPYVGLEEYCTWDICGITRGVIEKGEKIPKASSRNWICKHLDHTVPNERFFTSEVFTEDVLKQIDEHIAGKFNYGKDEESTDDVLDQIFGES